jgi:hypothetical protein
MKSDTQNTPLICNLDVFDSTERETYTQNTASLYQSAQDIREVKNGFEFLFPSTTDIISKLTDFIINERQCCSFLEFNLRIPPNNEPISLLLTCPEGTQEILRAELGKASV